MEQTATERVWLSFGRWLREQRDKAGLSQVGAAQRAGIDRQQWYRIESGKSGTKRETVISMANAVSANVNEALAKAGLLDPNNGTSTDPEGFYSGIDRLPPDRQIVARRAMKAIIESLDTQADHDTDYIDDE